MAEGTTTTLLCDCGMATPSQRALIDDAKQKLEAQPRAVVQVKDLCAAVATLDTRLVSLVRGSPLVVLACRPRAVHWLLHAAGIDTTSRRLDVVDMRREPGEVKGNLAACLAQAEDGAPSELESSPDWASWFPVVDRDRCQDCGQCASYCMFGVYTATRDGAVTVTHPHGCKTNCPACARLCPSAAIIFPKHDEVPFDGSVISDEEAVRARNRHYTQQMLGQDPYAALAARRQRVQLLRRRPSVEIQR